ncbi:MAG: shikimate kinase [Pyrinomonadaceae bacterium]
MTRMTRLYTGFNKNLSVKSRQIRVIRILFLLVRLLLHRIALKSTLNQMENSPPKTVLTGFMGVGKSTVARHLAYLLKCERLDLDSVIEATEKRTIADIINRDGEARFREIETKNLRKILQSDARIIALGGGAWTTEENRKLIKQSNCTTIWLESSFEHCWQNIKFSRRERPIAKNKRHARKLFEERRNYYCLADWHFIVRPELNSYELAKKIAEEVFLLKQN